MFAVLKPKYTPTMDRKPTGEIYQSVSWEKLGVATGMEDARRLSRAPVLSNDKRWLEADVSTVHYI